MKYQVIYADPPWQYRNKNTGESMKSGASAKYPTMAVEDICALPVQTLSDKNSVLFLWATAPFLQEGLQVMASWGFKYKTIITWRKIMSLGMGYWYRGQCEFLLFGVRGKVKAFRHQHPNFIQAKVLKHSEKPPEFRQLIEESVVKAFADPAKIELFARNQSPGWDVWGNEVESDVVLTDEVDPFS